jgi:hypothetical protein
LMVNALMSCSYTPRRMTGKGFRSNALVGKSAENELAPVRQVPRRDGYAIERRLRKSTAAAMSTPDPTAPISRVTPSLPNTRRRNATIQVILMVPLAMLNPPVAEHCGADI